MRNILILEGGFNEEHKISLTTAKEVKKAVEALQKQQVSNPKNTKCILYILFVPFSFHRWESS